MPVNGQVFLGGAATAGGPVKVTSDEEMSEQPAAVVAGGRRVEGGPQMLQLSLDSRRLYVTNSLYSVWDAQFYPDLVKCAFIDPSDPIPIPRWCRKGGAMLLVDVGETGALSLNKDFCVDFANVPTIPFPCPSCSQIGGVGAGARWARPAPRDALPGRRLHLRHMACPLACHGQETNKPTNATAMQCSSRNRPLEIT